MAGSHLEKLGHSRSHLAWAQPSPALGVWGLPAQVTPSAGPLCGGQARLGSLCRPPEDPHPASPFKNHCTFLVFHTGVFATTKGIQHSAFLSR